MSSVSSATEGCMVENPTGNSPFLNLPIDVVNKILDYDGSIKYRNGKYINQISKTDKRYEMLLNVPRKFNWIIENQYYNLIVNWNFVIFITIYDPEEGRIYFQQYFYGRYFNWMIE